MIKRIITFILYVAVFIIGLNAGESHKALKKKVLNRNKSSLRYITKNIPGKNIDGYWLYTPKNHKNKKNWPVLVFLHGGGIGEKPKINLLKRYGPLKHVMDKSFSNHSPKNLLEKFIIICPVLPENPKNFTLWIDNIKSLDSIIDSIINDHSGDPSRLYITGNSRGGNGVWRFPKYTKHSIAAIIPVCGFYMKRTNLNALVDIPVWMTCNTGDYNYKKHKKAASYIEALGGEKFFSLNTVRADILNKKHIFTSFKKKGHNAWTETYASRQIYKWMLNFQNINGKIIKKNKVEKIK